MRALLYAALALSLASNVYVHSRYVARMHPHTLDMFLAWDRGYDGYMERMGPVFARRIGSNAPASAVLGKPTTLDEAVSGVAMWVALWFIVLAGTLWFYPRRLTALAFAALAVYWAYLPDIQGGAWTRIYPWDMPAMALTAVGLVLYHRKPALLPALILVGAFFKDTVSILWLLPLVGAVQKRNSWKLFGCSLIAALTASVAMSSLVGSSGAISWRGWCSPDDVDVIRLLYNFEWLFTMHANTMWVAAGGVLVCGVVTALCRWKEHLPELAVLVVLAGGLMVGGVIHEYRIWLEAVPLCLWVLLNEYKDPPQIEVA